MNSRTPKLADLKTKGAWNINFVERFSKPFTRIGNPGYKTRSHQLLARRAKLTTED